MHVVHDSGFLPKPVPGEGYIFMCNFGFALSLSFVIKKKKWMYIIGIMVVCHREYSTDSMMSSFIMFFCSDVTMTAATAHNETSLLISALY